MKTLSRCTVLACLIVLIGCAPKVQPIHAEKWSEIETNIQENFLNYVDTMGALPKPYSFALNPGTLYYWDLYFINEGLMLQGFMEQARNNVDNFIFEIEKLGFVPNANDWGEDRSQTPYFSPMVRSYYEKSGQKDTLWLRKAYTAVLKEYEFWTNTNGNNIEDHSTSIPGLQRFSHHSDSATLIRFYDRVLASRFHISRDTAVEVKLEIASQRLTEAETMDFTPRFEGRARDFIAVDLNSNLWQYEKDLGFYERELGIPTADQWDAKAKSRSELIDKYLWSEERGLYLDYNFVEGRHSSVAAVITLQPLYWGFAPPAKARKVRENLPLFEYAGGLVVCEETESTIFYQWGDQAVWAPIQFLAMDAMKRYNFRDDTKRIATKWLNTVTQNYIQPVPATYPPFKYGDGARHPGFLYEKYTRGGEINDAEYPCSHMMGWSAATFLKALQEMKKLTPSQYYNTK